VDYFKNNTTIKKIQSSGHSAGFLQLIVPNKYHPKIDRKGNSILQQIQILGNPEKANTQVTKCLMLDYNK
jgi:hypothetical protein